MNPMPLPIRNCFCRKYDECLTVAAKPNVALDCRHCQFWRDQGGRSMSREDTIGYLRLAHFMLLGTYFERECEDECGVSGELGENMLGMSFHFEA